MDFRGRQEAVPFNSMDACNWKSGPALADHRVVIGKPCLQIAFLMIHGMRNPFIEISLDTFGL